ncbi:septation protein SepH [Nonomuraea sp. 10N515B]|uniref:septation protein SepH n=1 Tax=Nonomuraea sp. 10N515B TaxID=3457422 RepID=UPI003FCD09B8
MQELRLVAVSEDGTYLVLATAGRGTRFTLPVDDRLRAAVRGNFSRLGQYEIEVESPLRPKEIQARIRAGETAEEIAATAGIPVERVRWFEGPVLQEREYVAQQAQRVAVRMPGETAPGPTLGDLVAERLTRRGVPTDEIDWDSAKRDDGLWRVKLGYVWNGHTRHAEWLFDPRKRHVTPYGDEAMRLSSADFDPEPPVVEDTTVTPFAPRVAKLQPVPPLASDAVPFPSARREPEEPAVGYNPPPRSSETGYTRASDSPSREAAPFERAAPPRDAAPPSPETTLRHEPPSRESTLREEPPSRDGSFRPETPSRDGSFRPETPSRDDSIRPETPARETGHARPGETVSRRGGSSAWLPDFGSGRSAERDPAERDTDAIYAPAAPADVRPAPQASAEEPRAVAEGHAAAGQRTSPQAQAPADATSLSQEQPPAQQTVTVQEQLVTASQPAGQTAAGEPASASAAAAQAAAVSQAAPAADTALEPETTGRPTTESQPALDPRPTADGRATGDGKSATDARPAADGTPPATESQPATASQPATEGQPLTEAQGADVPSVSEASAPAETGATAPPATASPGVDAAEPAEAGGSKVAEGEPSGSKQVAKETKPPAPKPKPGPAAPKVPAARAGKDEAKEEQAVPVPSPPPAPAARQPRKGSRGRRASVPTWDEIMFGARRQE